jgi:ABC-type transport system involved in cytochrome c biogenesis ATPase subunit
MSVLLRMTNVSRAFRAGVTGCTASVQALRHVTFELHAGELLQLVGERGSGKSTLLRIAAGGIRPDSGEVTWTSPSHAGARSVALAGEHSAASALLTVREVLEYAALAADVPMRHRYAAVQRVLATAELQRLAERRTALLSSSELARLQLATALLPAPRVLLVDCPLAPLPRADWRAIAAIAREHAAHGGAVIAAVRTPLFAGVATRTLALRWGMLVPPAVEPVRRRLALDVDDAELAARVLAPRHVAERASDGRLTVSLDRGSAEEVLADCIRAGIVVRRSEVHTPGTTPGG